MQANRGQVRSSDQHKNWSECDDRPGLVTIADIPPWLRFNRFILSGYRRQLSVHRAVRSLLQLHNESVNVWVHLLPSMWFVYLFLGHPWSTSWTMQWSLASFIGIFGASAVYHLFMPCCCSNAGYLRLISCDVIGALLSITISAYSFIFYGNRCADPTVILACAVIFGISAIVMLLCIISFRMTVSQRFQLFGIHCLLRLLISQVIMLPRVMEHGATRSYTLHTVSFFAMMIGGLFNISRVPERWMPRTWRWIDYFGNSHNIWHVFCLLCCVLTMYGIMYDDMDYYAIVCPWER